MHDNGNEDTIKQEDNLEDEDTNEKEEEYMDCELDNISDSKQDKWSVNEHQGEIV